MDLEEPRKVEDEAILEVLQMQKEVGIEVFTDGGFHHQSYTTHRYDAVEGFASKYPKVEQSRPDASKNLVQMQTKPVASKLRRPAERESPF